MTIPLIQTAFAAGEIAPSLYGRVDLAKYHSAASTFRNAFVDYRGGAKSRAGSAYVLQSLTPVSGGKPPRIITFQFSLTQGYLLELGHDPVSGQNYMAFYFNGSPVIEATKNIAGITQANPAILNVPAHGYTTGDRISTAGIIGMAPLNGRFLTVTVIDADHFSVSMLNGTAVDSTAFPAYVAGGTTARLYRIEAPWAITDLPALKFTQSADVMSFTHPSYPPYDLARIAGNHWTLTATDFNSEIAAPGQPSAVASNHPSTGTSPITQPAAYAYVVTAVSRTGQESVASPVANVTDSVDMAITAGSITVTWPAVAGAAYYNIYRAPTSYNTLNGSTTNALPVPAGAIFSFVGISYGVQFVDSNTVPDTTQVPPLHKNPFAPGQILFVSPSTTGSGYTTATVNIVTSTGSGAAIVPVLVGGEVTGYIIQNAGSGYATGDYGTVSGDGVGAAPSITIGPQTGVNPGIVGYYQQRRVYASSDNAPDTLWLSKPGAFTNFDSGIPVQADDAITATPWSQQVNGIQWVLTEPGGLIVMTGAGAWSVTGSGGSALNPVAVTAISTQATPQMFAGISATIAPLPIYQDILFVQAKGNAVRDMTYNYFSNNWAGSDQTVLSSHLFLGYDLLQWAWCEEPYKIVWAARCDGVLLSFTFLKEQEVFGWARHDTAGAYLSVASVSEPPVDALYCVVQRATPAGQFYFIERGDNHIWLDSEDPWCVDAGLSLPMPEYSVALTADSVGGAVNFSAASAVFVPGMVGSVLRVSGGIANLTAYTDSQHMTGTWVLSPAAAVGAS